MAHVLLIHDGPYGGSPPNPTTTVTLTDNTVSYLRHYKPETPTLAVSEITSMLSDGGDISNARHRNVTETAECMIVGATGAAVQATINDIERLFRAADIYHRTGVGRAVWVELQMDSDAQTWRSELLSGRLELANDAWDTWANNKCDVVLYWTRRYYWEETTETSVNKATAQTSRTTGAVRISNDPTNCYIDINAADLSKGSLPAPAYLDLENVSGSSIALTVMHAGQYAELSAYDDDTLTLAYDAEDASEVAANVTRTVKGQDNGTHTGATHATILTDSTKSWTSGEHIGRTIWNVTDGSTGVVTSNLPTTATCAGGLTGGTDNDFDLNDVYAISGSQFYGGYYIDLTWASSALATSTRVLQWTITGANVTAMAGRYFRVLARFLGTPDTDTLATVKIEAPSGTPSVAIYSGPEVRLDATQLQDLGTIRALPIPKTMYLGDAAGAMSLTLWLRDANATGSLLLDYLFLLPLDSYRLFDFRPSSPLFVSSNDNIIDDVYHQEAYIQRSTAFYPYILPRGGPIWLWPDRNQRIYFHEVSASGMTIGDDYDVLISYRPRRLTV